MGNEKTPQLIRKHEIIVAFHDNYYHVLLGVALYLTLNESDANELVASTFEKICTWQLEELEDMILWEKPKTLAYLSRTLNNTHIDTIRKTKKRKAREHFFCETKMEKLESSTESIYLSQEKIKVIKKAYYETLELAPKIIRVGFYLKTERGYKNKEIATLLKIPPSTIGTKFHRLRLQIKERIKIG